ncbi:phage tail protein [Paenibacillus oralis]|uniref:Phage tail protein n=1 Tax=Paenibacillus oralis TaxID=2490856 RepID=A0A3P3TZR7_9BACL|nr:phage baseplate assembly protein V [Paenibacillus oralis]RRJ63176.1 phage tail protein [Paenibacillus oralis]
MSEAVYTSAHIVVSHYKFERITELVIHKLMNDHGKLLLSGIISEDLKDKYIEQAEASDTIQVAVQDQDKPVPLFYGVITNISVQATRGVRSITIEAHSLSALMDIRKQTRSFQNKTLTYKSLFHRLIASYPDSDLIDEASQGKTIGGLLVQYQETDWTFLRRLASHFHASLVPVSSQPGVKLYVGVPGGDNPRKLDEYNYSMKKDLQDYKLKSENGVEDISEQDSICYTVASHKLLELGDAVTFQGRTWYVGRVETKLENGVLSSLYDLKDAKGLRCRTEYPYALAGTSLFGTILDVAKDKVKVKLHIDQDQPVNEAMWFAYSTVYSSPDGSGWYCMPEVGDEVRLYFPDEQEKHAFAASSVDTDSANPQKRSDPAVKSISTKYGKEIVFKPGAVEIIGGGQLLMRLTDEGGIEINSDKKISLTAMEDIEITGGAKILIQGESGIEFIQGNTSLKVEDEVTFTGGRVNIK